MQSHGTTNEAQDGDVNFGHTVSRGGWIVFDPTTKQIKKRFKTHTAGKSYAQAHGLGFASAEYYFDTVKGQAVAEEYGDGETLPGVSTQQWQQAYQKAVQAVKLAKTPQEYEIASERASKIKELLASKGINVGPVLGQQAVAEEVAPQINDAWFKQGAFQTYKKAAPIKYDVPGDRKSTRLNSSHT